MKKLISSLAFVAVMLTAEMSTPAQAGPNQVYSPYFAGDSNFSNSAIGRSPSATHRRVLRSDTQIARKTI